MKNKFFVVLAGDLRLRVHKGSSGMYIAESLDIAGLNTQGKTIEEAIANSHDAAETLAESRRLMAADLASDKTVAKPTGKKTTKSASRKRHHLAEV